MPVRPKSIVWFDVAFWLMIALGLVQAAWQWTDIIADPALRPVIARFGVTPFYIIMAAIVLVLVVLWYCIAYRGSVIAKWLFVLLSVYTLYSAVTAVLANGWSAAPPVLTAHASLAMQVVATILLFRPDTKAWFDKGLAA